MWYRRLPSLGRLRIGVDGGRTWLLIMVLLFVVLLVPSTLQAHNGGTAQLTNVLSGPFRLYAWTQPDPMRAGEIHISVGLTDASLPAASGLEQPVADAVVSVTLIPVDPPGEPIPVATEPWSLSAVYFEADATLPTAGLWRFMINVTSPAGQGQAAFALTVLPARALNGSLLAGAGLAFCLLLLLIGLRNRRQAREKTS